MDQELIDSRKAAREAKDLLKRKESKKRQLQTACKSLCMAGLDTSAGYKMCFDSDTLMKLKARTDHGHALIPFRDANGIRQTGMNSAQTASMISELEDAMYIAEDNLEMKLDAVDDATSIEDLAIITF